MDGDPRDQDDKQGEQRQPVGAEVAPASLTQCLDEENQGLSADGCDPKHPGSQAAEKSKQELVGAGEGDVKEVAAGDQPRQGKGECGGNVPVPRERAGDFFLEVSETGAVVNRSPDE